MAGETDAGYVSPDEAFDPRPADYTPFSLEDPAFGNTHSSANSRRVAVLRTSDRIAFKSCRRKWGWGSHLRGNLGSKQAPSPLWVGSGFHFALEDFHGHNRYGSARKAFDAYVTATRKKGGIDSLPVLWEEDWALAQGMLDYYQYDWLSSRDPMPTLYKDGQPQVEVNFRIQVPLDEELLQAYGYDECIYSGTIDRVGIDENGLIWIFEYKTAKVIVTQHFATDPQVTAYCWAARLLYPEHTLGGVIYQQHLKKVPEAPRYLANGKLSTDKRQSTTYHAYRREVQKIYGDVAKAPGDITGCLNALAESEDIHFNKWIRRDRIYRNEHSGQAEGTKVLLEAADMLNPDLDLYPNPTRENCRMCSFNGPCVSMDDGSDYEQELEALYMPREASYDSWRSHLPAGENEQSPQDIFKVY